MAIVRPFYGFRFTEKAGKIGDLCCPPYNLLTETERKAFTKKNTHNIVRLEAPGEDSADFKKAKKVIDKWIKDGLIKEDDEAGLYIYEQSFELDGNEYRLRGFIGRVYIYDYERGIILPHLETDAIKKEDRYCLLKSICTNISPVCSIYEDEKGIIEKSMGKLTDREPDQSFKDANGVTHKFWACPRSIEVDRISANMAGKKLYITEGHHRYEAALRYRKHLVEKGIIEEMGENEADYIMMMLVDSKTREMAPRAVHKIIHSLPKFSSGKFTTAAGEYFDVSTTKSQETAKLKIKNMKENGDIAFSMFDGKKYNILKLKADLDKKELLPELSSASREIGANIIEKLIIENVLGLNDEKLKKAHIKYTSSVDEASSAVVSGEANCSLILESVKLSEIISVAGEVLPKNSTRFYPVPWAGFVMNKLDKEPKTPKDEKKKQDYVMPEAEFVEI